MGKKVWILILILSLAINAAAFTTMGFNYYHRASTTPSALCPVSPGDQHLYKALGLSEPQLTRMDSIARAFHSRLDRLGSDMSEKRGLLLNLLKQKDADSEKIEKLRKEMAGIQDEIQREVITHIEAIKEILNPEQTEHFFSLLRNSMEHEGSHLLSENRGK
jgi:Spy/CpxP family protein refolding chaperone